MRSFIVAAILCASIMGGSAGYAASVPDPAQGLKFAKIECGNCHVVEQEAGKMPPKRVEGAAPHFKTIAYDPEMTADKIRETLRLPHGAMANLVLAEKDIENIISYIVSLRH